MSLAERYKPYMKPVLSAEQLEKVKIGPSSPQLRTILQRCPKMVKKMNELSKLTDWRELLIDPTVGVSSWIRTSDEGLKSMKVVFEVEGTVADVLLVITDQESYRKIYDPAYHSGLFLEKLDEFTWIFYQRVKKVSIVASRDFMLTFHFHYAPDENNGRGVMYFIGFSDPAIENLVPLPDDVVRGDMPIAGWKLEDISSSLSHPKTKVT